MEHKLIREDLILCPDIEGYSFIEDGKCETCGETLEPQPLDILDVLKSMESV